MQRRYQSGEYHHALIEYEAILPLCKHGSTYSVEKIKNKISRCELELELKIFKTPFMIVVNETILATENLVTDVKIVTNTNNSIFSKPHLNSSQDGKNIVFFKENLYLEFYIDKFSFS